jgi:hypothetical protein
MKRWHVVGAGILALALLGFIATSAGMAMQTPAPTPAVASPTGCGPWGPTGEGQGAANQPAGPRGMMGGQGMMGGNGPWANCPWNGLGPGMMGGIMGPGMMGGMMGFYPATAMPISEADAQQRLAAFAATLGSDLKVDEFLPFASNYDAELVDGSGAAVAEVLVDRYTGAAYPEPGPNMMWNGRWGMMAGAGALVQYDEAAAQKLAEQFLSGYLPGASVLEGTAFPGYYTFDYGRGQLEGMLSVNAATGEIWVHTWHGPALANAGEATPAP